MATSLPKAALKEAPKVPTTPDSIGKAATATPDSAPKEAISDDESAYTFSPATDPFSPRADPSEGEGSPPTAVTVADAPDGMDNPQADLKLGRLPKQSRVTFADGAEPGDGWSQAFRNLRDERDVERYLDQLYPGLDNLVPPLIAGRDKDEEEKEVRYLVPGVPLTPLSGRSTAVPSSPSATTATPATSTAAATKTLDAKRLGAAVDAPPRTAAKTSTLKDWVRPNFSLRPPQQYYGGSTHTATASAARAGLAPPSVMSPQPISSHVAGLSQAYLQAHSGWQR